MPTPGPTPPQLAQMFFTIITSETANVLFVALETVYMFLATAESSQHRSLHSARSQHRKAAGKQRARRPCPAVRANRRPNAPKTSNVLARNIAVARSRWTLVAGASDSRAGFKRARFTPLSRPRAPSISLDLAPTRALVRTELGRSRRARRVRAVHSRARAIDSRVDGGGERRGWRRECRRRVVEWQPDARGGGRVTVT